MTPEDRANVGEFFRLISDRLEAGASEYGDSAKTRPTGELCDEIREELLDVCGWAYWLFRRVTDIRDRVSEVEGRT